MHIGDDVRQCRAGKQLEPALGVLDHGRLGRGKEPQDQVERMHQEIP